MQQPQLQNSSNNSKGSNNSKLNLDLRKFNIQDIMIAITTTETEITVEIVIIDTEINVDVLITDTEVIADDNVTKFN